MSSSEHGDGESPESLGFQNKSYRKTRKKRRKTEAFVEDQVERVSGSAHGLEARAPHFQAGSGQKNSLLNFRLGQLNKVCVMSSEINLKAEIAKDSRGRDTVAVTLQAGDVKVRGDVPAGASTGEDEANTVEPATAIENIHGTILALIQDLNLDLSEHSNLIVIEKAIAEAAGDNFSKLGANATVPVSRALWRYAANVQELELCEYIARHCGQSEEQSQVKFFMNIFNGGLHALREGEKLGRERIDIQEVMIVPQSANSYREALAMGDAIDAALKELLHKDFPAESIMRADEAGFSVKGLGASREAIDYVMKAIEEAGYLPGADVGLALDVAASSFYQTASDKYLFQGKEIEASEMIEYYLSLAEAYPGKIVSIEDGLGENDWQHWPALTSELLKRDILSVGDDLFVTQMGRLQRGVREKSASAILIKVNQNGNMQGTVDVMNYAKANEMECIVSHRSGETLDDSIADLAQGMSAFGLKTGDPQPPKDFPDQEEWVRRVKYLRMLEFDK